MNRMLFYWVVLVAGCAGSTATTHEAADSVAARTAFTTDSLATADSLLQVNAQHRKDSLQRDSSRSAAAQQPLLRTGLVDVETVVPGIRVELKYSTADNFLGFDVYGPLTKAFLQPDVAQMLATAQQTLRAQHPNYTLLVYDAARPLHIQQSMWDTLRNRPLDRSKYVSNPANGGSLHNYGAAVDLTIADSTGTPLDMGTPYDFFGPAAHPAKEAQLLAEGKLTAQQVANRKLLREAMRSGGFFGITTEWWHFNACTRAVAIQRYAVIP